MIRINSYGIKRGEVYYVRFDRTVGSEQSVGRPAVVISSNTGNDSNQTVNCIYTTTSVKPMGVNVPLTSTTRKSWALCNQIVTLDKSRFGDRMCTLTLKEMEQIDAGIALALGLTLSDPEAERELEEAYQQRREELEQVHKTELAAKDKEIEALKDRILEIQVETDVVRKRYDKAVEMLADRAEQKAEEPMPEQEEPVNTEPDAALVDINRCSEAMLRGLGFPVNVARMIVAARPYIYKDDLRGVPGVTRLGYQLVEHKITVGDTTEYVKKKKPEKKETPAMAETVNINTCDAGELAQVTGLGIQTAETVIAHRRKHGAFKSMDDLAKVRRMGKKNLEKMDGRIEF